MAHQESTMTTSKILVEGIENILETDLFFLLDLAPRELVILATALKDLIDQEKKHSLK